MISYKILWIDDDQAILESAGRLFRQHPWTLCTAAKADDARELLLRETFAVVVADQGLQAATGVDILEFAKARAPTTTRILLTGGVEMSVIEQAVNRGHVFRFVTKPWNNDQLVVDIAKAIEHHKLKMAESSLLREITLQNRKYEQLTSGLEQLVNERTVTAERSKVEVEKQLTNLRELVRFIKDLSNLTSPDELMGLIRKEVRAFHDVRPPVLGYVDAERGPMLLYFHGKQAIAHLARVIWSNRSRIRSGEEEDRNYLMSEFGRTFLNKVLAVPLKRRAAAGDHETEPPATLFFEHALADEGVDRFLSFISERLQPLSIALDRILLDLHLKYTSRQWESTFDGIKDPIAVIDRDFTVVNANRHFCSDLDANRIAGRPCHQILASSESMCRGCPVPTTLTTGKPQKGQIRRGNRIYEVLSYPIRLHDNLISTSFINHYVDVTEARELDGRMVQNEKMAAIGLLAGNIAHELNNPLTGIRSLAQVLLAELPPGQLHDDINEVERAAGRSQKIIENLLDFSRGGTEERQVRISLNEIVRRTLPMLKTAIREHRSEILLCEQEGEIRVEPHLMQQVVFNLVNNACQAMKDPGTITIETDIEEGKCRLHVKDTGVGIPSEIIESIFEPFFTTKEKGQGTGLGLSMSRQVIEKFGGDIAVESQVGQGTHFTVCLPLVGIVAESASRTEKRAGA